MIMGNEYTYFTTLEQWLAYAERQHPQSIDLGLERVQKVRQSLELNFECPVFTVAGTNGKGSTCAMLESILVAAGYEVGVYTSPHMLRFEERCRINGEMVQGSDLFEHFVAVERAREQAGNINLTYFEFTTLVIMHYMSYEGLDAVILEVGLGGRYDAVNIIDPDCSVITCVDIDHIEFLGDDRESIGWEKAGVMRSGRPVIVNDPSPPERMLGYAKEVNADLYQLGRDYQYKFNAQRWSWQGRRYELADLSYPALPGENQLANAAAVLAALEAMIDRLPVSPLHISQGLAQATLSGRFQVLLSKPVVVLDVAHNPHAAKALVKNLIQMRGTEQFPKTHAVFGVMKDKDVRAILELMHPVINSWYFTDLPTSRAMSAAELKDLWENLAPSLEQAEQVNFYCSSSPLSALQLAVKEASRADRIVVFGSFYTVGGVLEQGD